MKKSLFLSALALNSAFCAQASNLESENIKLESITVSERARRDDINYGSKELVKGTTRLNLTNRQTPQSLTIITEAMLKDQNIQDYQALLRVVPGITLDKWDERIYPKSRGFKIDYYLIDSMPSFGGFHLGANDMSLVPFERIEVVKGANGLLAGAGNPAASLNFIRKRADSRELKGSFSLSGGSYDKYAAKGDVQTPLNEDGSARARFSFAKEKADSYMDYYKRENLSIYGVGDIDIGNSSWLSAGVFYQDLRRKGIRWGGMPAFNMDGSRYKFSKNQIFSQPWTHWDIKTLDLFSDFRHYFSNDASINFSYSFRKSHTDVNLLYYGGRVLANGEGDISGLSVYANKRDETINNFDIYANLPYEFDFFSGEFVAGAMYNIDKKDPDLVSSYWNSQNTPKGLEFTSNTKINFNNLSINDPKFPYINQNNAEKTTQKAIYFANKLTFGEELHLLVGARSSYYKFSETSGKNDRNFVREITPYLGVVYDITPNYSLYASYTSIFLPQNAKDINGKYIDPIEGKDYEAGIKGEYFEGRLNASLGVFKILQDNLAIKTDKFIIGTKDSAYKAGKGIVSKGVELDISGEVNENLSLSFGATHFSSKDANGKTQSTDSHKTTLNFFAKYESGPYRAGIGARYKSKIHSGEGKNKITQKAYTIANLSAGYKASKNLDFALNVDNLFNKKYFEGIGTNKMVYGDPRSINLTFTYNF